MDAPRQPGAENLRLVLGLKLRALRDGRGWTLQELARRAGMAISYLSEIEKGKKYPKPEKLLALAGALGVGFEELVSPRVAEELSALSAFAGSDFLREFPFHLFGLDASDLFELVAGEPEKAGALLRTFGEIVHRHDLEVEQLLFAALRSYQQLQRNSFPEIERAAESFRRERGWSARDRIEEDEVLAALVTGHGYRVDFEALAARHDLSDLRSVYAGGTRPTLFVNGRLSPRQRAFAMARELGFRVLGLEQRPRTSSWVKAESFEQVLANFHASSFAGAVLLPRAAMLEELRRFFGAEKFRARALVEMLSRFGATPEMLFYRISQLAPSELGLADLFFVRFFLDSKRDRPRLTKVLNLSRFDVPYGVSPAEHPCRRWPGVALLEDTASVRAATLERPAVAAALCRFQSEPVEFLVMSLARPLTLRPRTLSSVSLGFLADEHLREVAAFLDDRGLRRREVDLTCERCPLPAAACAERAAPARVLAARDQLGRREAALDALVATAERRPPRAPGH